MSDQTAVGRLSQVCERWIYSACLCCALDSEEQARSGFRYGLSVYQAALTPSRMTDADGVDPTVAARLSLAARHGQRIAGHTQAALDYVWEHAEGTPRLAAGLWASDLHMCQGRFRDAEGLAAELETLAPAGESEFRGDVARLRHLTHRFAFAFDAARRYLDDAAACYRVPLTAFWGSPTFTRTAPNCSL